MKREERREKRVGRLGLLAGQRLLMCFPLFGIFMPVAVPQDANTSCKPYNPMLLERFSTDVFYGRVLGVTPPDASALLDADRDPHRLKLRVGRVKKGSLSGTVELNVVWKHRCWPGSLAEGKEYLIYASPVDGTPHLVWAVESPSLFSPAGLRIVAAMSGVVAFFLILLFRSRGFTPAIGLPPSRGW